jgi:hypothetical protein
MLDAFAKLNVSLFGIFDHVIGLFFCGLYGWLLDYDGFSKILEELVELLQSLLDLLNVIVTGADST